MNFFETTNFMKKFETTLEEFTKFGKTGAKVITASALALSLAACNVNDIDESTLPPKPDDATCDKEDMEWNDELQVWQCDFDKMKKKKKKNTTGSGIVYFLNGQRYQSKNELVNSSSYKTFKSGSKFGSYGKSSSSSVSSGKSSGGFGGKSSGSTSS